jgi:segregation and condensation protein B
MSGEEEKPVQPAPSDGSEKSDLSDGSDGSEKSDPSETSDLSETSDPSDMSDVSDEVDEEYRMQIAEVATEEMLLSRLESLIFVYPEPISVRRLARILCLEGKRVRELVEKLIATYQNRGIVLTEVSGGFQFHTHPDNAPIVRAAIKIKPMRMSRPALETLAIVAYRQPITRAEVEEIRRVDSGGTLKFLFERGLVRVLGRKEEPGRPMIYGTTAEFLALFGLKSLGDLPSLHEFTELWDEHRELVDEQEADEK